MLFKKSGKIRRQEDHLLLANIEVLKEKLLNQKELVNKSLDPSLDVLFNLKLTEAKYLFLLKEARIRKTSM